MLELSPTGRVKRTTYRNPNAFMRHPSLSETTSTKAKNVIKNVKGGEIVLFHDSLKAKGRMEFALPRALEYWSEKGFEFRGLDESLQD